MSRDKYAQNHKITLNEGTGTLTIDGDLETTADVVVGNNLTVTNNVSVTGDFAVAGEFDIPHVDLSNPVPQVYRLMGAELRPNDADALTHITYGVTSNFGRLTVNAINPPATIYFLATAPSLPHGAKITSFSFTGDVSSAGNAITIRLYDTNGLASTLIDTLALSSLGGRTTFTSTISPSHTVNYNNNGRSIFLAVTIARANNAGPVYIDYVDIAYDLKTFPQDSTTNPI